MTKSKPSTDLDKLLEAATTVLADVVIKPNPKKAPK